MKERNNIIAWIFFTLIAVSVTGAIIINLSTLHVGDKPAPEDVIILLVPVSFAFVGALILSHQPRNTIGFLMLLPGLSHFFLVDAYLRPLILLSTAPASSSPIFLLILWFSNWNWLLIVFPILFIMVLFPTGRPLSPRWAWLIYFGVVLCAVFILLASFSNTFAPGSGDASWTVRNPIGFIPDEWVNKYFIEPWFFSMPLLTLLCAASLVVRYRHSRAIEREQIKWLFYAGLVFAAFYIPNFIGETYNQAENILNILFSIGMLAFPVAIAIAILRHRLFDIDVIIRRTLIYSALSATLALVFFGGVAIMQQIFGSLTETENSPIAIVLSTLLIAGLFGTVHRLVQNFIDRRFFRKKYDAGQALANFAATARDETDIERLKAELLAVVQETVQPEKVSLWLQDIEKNV